MSGTSEVFLYVSGTSERYSVSNLGRVKSNKRWQIAKNGMRHYTPEKFLKGFNSNGYLEVCIILDGEKSKRRNKKIHRIVASEFLEKKCGMNIVNHINSNKKDNRVENLEWTNYSGNLRHAYSVGERKCISKSQLGDIHTMVRIFGRSNLLHELISDMYKVTKTRARQITREFLE